MAARQLLDEYGEIEVHSRNYNPTGVRESKQMQVRDVVVDLTIVEPQTRIRRRGDRETCEKAAPVTRTYHAAFAQVKHASLQELMQKVARELARAMILDGSWTLDGPVRDSR